ncbi:MAG: glycosyltransferase family 1 protein [candidate division KSB1 bacterium]
MRIGIDATCLPSALAGAGRYIHGLIHGLAAVDHENEYFIFIKAHDAACFDDLPANLHLVRVPVHSRLLRLIWQHTRAGAQAQKLGLDVWHGTHYTLPNFTHGLTCVATFHDLGVFHHPQLYPLDKRYYFRRVMQQAVARAQHLVSVSAATTSDLQALLAQAGTNGHARHQRVTTILPGVEEKFFQPVAAAEKARVRREYNLPAPFILFVGTLEKRKNLVLLLHAFHEFCRRQPGTQVLALAGQESNGSAEVAATIAQLGLQQRVRVIGDVAEADLPGLYQAANLFVMPSLYEGFGFPLLEAMAGGVVALAANNSSLRELAAHAQMLCEATPAAWATQIAALLNDTKLRQELSWRGMQHARQFSWVRMAERLREVYESSAAGKLSPKRNGKAASFSPPPLALAAAVKKTLVYSDLFEYPLTAEEIHRGLIEHAATHLEVRHELEALHAAGEIAKREPYYCLPGREHCIELRERRRQTSAMLLQNYSGVLRLIKNFPFIRTVALSGTLAFQNAKGEDDLDLFLLVAPGRLWTVYSSLALWLKMLGQRRAVCLNCLLDTAHLAITDRDFFVAHQILFLRPLAGAEALRDFWQANEWSTQYLPQMPITTEAFNWTQAEDAQRARKWWRNALEAILGWRGFNVIETALYTVYRRRIRRLTSHLDNQAIVAEAGRIKLFTNNHRFRIQRRLEQRVQQLQEYPSMRKQEEPQSYATL